MSTHQCTYFLWQVSCIISMAFREQDGELEYCLYLTSYILSHYGFILFLYASMHYYLSKTVFFLCRLLQRSKLSRMSQTTLQILSASVQILVTTMVLSLYQRAWLISSQRFDTLYALWLCVGIGCITNSLLSFAGSKTHCGIEWNFGTWCCWWGRGLEKQAWARIQAAVWLFAQNHSGATFAWKGSSWQCSGKYRENC